MGSMIWIVVIGLVSGICIALMVVGMKIYFSNVQGDSKSTIEDFVDEGGMLFIKKIDL